MASVTKAHRSAAAAVLGAGLLLAAAGTASAGPLGAAAPRLGSGAQGERHCGGLPLAQQALSDSIVSRDSLTGLCDAFHTNGSAGG
ncbi:hypothetical protein ACFOSC_07265 [Streptantibioticus rubrisoli]|uniref:Uncharacterized protein n=1 Tax=Streptantibioticus rubrisoli TaxID=1387313 RepID=A0ABT1P9Z6_9ACTN|nr:hypothetical protein [Streptantibioticus rubrisoli]MCQ4041160.1 hypothetical protein [Streptantibioticus rubrisoli]